MTTRTSTRRRCSGVISDTGGTSNQVATLVDRKEYAAVVDRILAFERQKQLVAEPEPEITERSPGSGKTRPELLPGGYPSPLSRRSRIGPIFSTRA